MPFIVDPGLSGFPGLLGSVELEIEIGWAFRDIGSAVLHVVGVAGSGGSLLGMSIGLEAIGIRSLLHGICVAGTTSATEGSLAALRAEAAAHLPAPVVGRAGVRLLDDLANAYDVFGRRELEAVLRVATLDAVILDPTHTAKAWLGLERLVASGRSLEARRWSSSTVAAVTMYLVAMTASRTGCVATLTWGCASSPLAVGHPTHHRRTAVAPTAHRATYLPSTQDADRLELPERDRSSQGHERCLTCT